MFEKNFEWVFQIYVVFFINIHQTEQMHKTIFLETYRKLKFDKIVAFFMFFFQTQIMFQ